MGRDWALRRLSVVAPLAVLAVSLLTVAITTVGPRPYRISTHPHILDVGNVLVEPVDRLVLLSWWLVPIVLGLVIWARGRRPTTSRLTTVAGWTVGSVSVVLAVTQVLLDEDEIGLYPGISLRALLLGAGAAGVVLMTWYSRTRVASVATWFILIPLGLIGIAAAIQTPDGVTDTDSFRYTSDELAAPATGGLPLATFIPQYSTLLGLPIAPLLRALPQQSLWIILLWLLVLQVVTVLLAVRLPVRVGGWRMLLPAAAVIILPVVATGPSGLNGTTYFAGLPMRLLLPVAALSIALAVTSGDDGRRGRAPAIRYALLGVVVGLTVLNNLDFGGPAAVAIFVGVALQTRAQRLPRLGVLVLGAATPFVAYGLVGVATGRPIDWASGLTFPRVFGTEGYFNVAMQPLGLHVVFAALFGSATLIGALILATTRLPRQSWLRRQGFLLLTVGLWSLLSMTYFAGRSYTATLQGHALQAGLTVACFLPLLRATLRRLRALPSGERSWAVSSAALGLLAVTTCLASLSLVSHPSVYLASLSARSPGPSATLMHQVAALASAVRQDPATAAALRGGVLEQWLDRPSLTALASGVPGRVIVNNPGYFAVSTEFSELQCQRLRDSETALVVMTPSILASLAREPVCSEALDVTAAHPISADPALVSVPVRRPPR